MLTALTAAGGLVPTADAVLSVARAAATEAGRHMIARRGAAVETTKLNVRDLVTAVDGECQEIIARHVRDAFPEHALLGEEDIPPGPEAAAAALDEMLQNEWLWIVDPIDGTTNFASDLPMSVVSIGVAQGGAPQGAVVFDPWRDELYEAWRGGGATLNGEPARVADARTLEEAVICAPCPNNPSAMVPAIRSIGALMPRARSLRVLGSGVLNFAWVACGRMAAYYEHELAAWDTAAGTLLVQEAGGTVTHTDGAPFTLRTRSVLASNGHLHEALCDALRDADAQYCETRSECEITP